MTFQEEKTLHDQGDNLYYALRDLHEIMSKKQMSACEWRRLDSADKTMREYDKLIRTPYAEIRNADRRLTEARAVLAQTIPVPK